MFLPQCTDVGKGLGFCHKGFPVATLMEKDVAKLSLFIETLIQQSILG